jgi:hypothetical protein
MDACLITYPRKSLKLKEFDTMNILFKPALVPFAGINRFECPDYGDGMPPSRLAERIVENRLIDYGDSRKLTTNQPRSAETSETVSSGAEHGQSAGSKVNTLI